MNPVIDQIYATRSTLSSQGEVMKLSAAVSRAEGMFLYNILNARPQAVKTLEVGCALGLSSLHICEALKNRPGAQHFIVEPFQKRDWKSAGFYALERAGLKNLTVCIEELSEIALPGLLKEHEGTFDFIFIDGWHTFDQTMLESYYALRLLKKGGVLVIDDCDLGGLAKVAKYLSRYPHVKRIGQVLDYPDRPIIGAICRVTRFIPVSMDMRHRLPKYIRKFIRRPNMIAFEKIGDDMRPWNWYAPF